MDITIGLTFPGELKDEAILCYLCKKFDIILNIVEASFSTDIGWAILILEGSEEELKKAYAASDLIISRAGSGSIFEIAALGKPSILIPLPESAQGHQSHRKPPLPPGRF